MKRLLEKYNIIRSFIFLTVVALTVYLLPRADSTRLSYTEGRPWEHQLLTAPFDIPVYRDTASVTHMLDSIKAAYIPVYRINQNPGEKIHRLLSGSLINNAHLRQTIDRIYTDGIISPESRASLGNKHQVQIVEDNRLRIIDTSNARTPREAFALLDSVITAPQQRQWLQTVAIERYLEPNLMEDSLNNERVFESRIRPVTAAYAVLQQGERIIDRGDIVTPQLATILDTYETMAAEKASFSSTQTLISLGGQTLLAIILTTLIFAFLYIYRRDIYDNIRALCSILLLYCLFVALSSLTYSAMPMAIFLVPFTITAVLLVVFFDSYTALFIYMCEILVNACFTDFPLEFIFIEMCAGCAAIGSMHELSRRSQLIRTAFIVLAAYIISYLSMELTATAQINTFSTRVTVYFALNSLLITFAYILIFVYEKLFGLISTVTLVELCDINNPLLRQLSEQCPGTFQHCMSVSNLASNAAARIGANVQLVRTGALYHDIGKTLNPAFFTENQYGVNPHDALTPELSARVLHNHVTDGLKLASNAKLPRVVSDLIAQHHGTGKTKYFYIQYLNEHPGETVDEAMFMYPGPDPQTREASLLMMADSVEAASRSLSDHSPEAITNLVNKIIDTQVADGLHNQSPISFRDINMAKEAFIQRLRTMYHSRIAYPKPNT